MDSTVFIRSKVALAAWVSFPLLAALAVGMGSRAFYNAQEASYLRHQSLDRFIPEMLLEEERFNQFIKGYVIKNADSSSLEDATIQLLNEAADTAQFKITSINLTQARDAKPGTVKVVVSVEGVGPCRSIAAFLQDIKKRDPLIYEEQLQLTRAVEGEDLLQAEALFGRIYIENTGGRL